MAILTFVNHSVRSLQKMIEYITDTEKTLPYYVFGIGTNPFYALEEFQFIQRIWPRGYNIKPYKQVILSFQRIEKSNSILLKNLCVEAGKCLIYDRRQIIGAIHFDTNNLHCHYIINNIGLDGSCYEQKYSVVYFKREVNRIFRDHGFQEEIYYYQSA